MSSIDLFSSAHGAVEPVAGSVGGCISVPAGLDLKCICGVYTFGRMKQDPLADCTGFDWDEANLDKNWEKHGVAFWECEEVFLNRPLVVKPDERHSTGETRYYALGRSEARRLLFVVFAVRKKRIRPISFRDMTAKERRVYEFHAKKDSEVH